MGVSTLPRRLLIIGGKVANSSPAAVFFSMGAGAGGVQSGNRLLVTPPHGNIYAVRAAKATHAFP